MFALVSLSLDGGRLIGKSGIVSTLGRVIPGVDVRSVRVPCETITTSLCANRRMLFSEKPLFSTVETSVSVPSLFEPIGCNCQALISKKIIGAVPVSELIEGKSRLMVTFSIGSVSISSVERTIVARTERRRNEVTSRGTLDLRAGAIVSSVEGGATLAFVSGLGLTATRNTGVVGRGFSDSSSRPRLTFRSDCCDVLSHAFSVVGRMVTEGTTRARGPSVLIGVPFSTCSRVNSCTETERVSRTNEGLVGRTLSECRTTIALSRAKAV